MDEYLRNWIKKALDDFKIAKHELSFPAEEIATGPVCFHSQQMVEKLLKAYLIFKETDFERSHDKVQFQGTEFLCGGG
jgi:HEPN domain-containing protein